MIQENKKVFVVIDMQNDFIVGSLANNAAKAIVPYIVRRIGELETGTTVVFTRDTHNDDYLNTPEGRKLPVKHCIEGSDGWQIDKNIAAAVVARKDELKTLYIDKPTFGYGEWNKISAIKKASKIEICGTCTDICVVSNALSIKAVNPSAEISVDAHLCAGVTPELHKAALDVMKSCQIDIVE
jgi:nicotinamidase/pyrazinamidase